MSNNKQSSVDWLFDELARINFEYATSKITPRDFQEQKEKIKQQAKAMHKEEIANAYISGVISEMNNPLDAMNYKIDGEEYYNETFNTKEKGQSTSD